MPSIWGYGLATVIFAVFGIRLLIGGWVSNRSINLHTAILICALVLSALWAGCISLAVASLAIGEAKQPDSELFWALAQFFDVSRMFAWHIFLGLMVTGWNGRSSKILGNASRVWLCILLIGLALSSMILPQPVPWLPRSEIEITRSGITAFYPWLGLSIFGLALAEQLFQRTPTNRLWAIKPLVIGLAGMFTFDLIVYSGAVLFHQVDAEIWAVRGIAHALVMFFVAIASRRNAAWTLDLFVSRGMVFQSTAILVAGLYLIIVAGAAYWVNFFGGSWGKTLQVAILFTAMLGLATLLMSGTLRSRLKVFISKNLFSYRYEYRKEWLRFTALLGTSEHGENLYQQVIRALAELVESNGGAIWLVRDGVSRQVARLNMPEVNEAEPVMSTANSSLMAFLSLTGWVIQIDEVNTKPEQFLNLILPSWLISQKEAWIIIPLPNPNDVSLNTTDAIGAEIVGFVVLTRPRTTIDVNWEVRDLLKTASRQAASYLAQYRAQEALVELEKFDAFNRMSAFVVHDLKNLVAQLALLLKNAERHRDNPEFQHDMLATVDHVVGRMNNLMLQLRIGTTSVENARAVELNAIIKQIIRIKAASGVEIETELAPDLRILAHADRIERVVGHIVQNAIEATLANEFVGQSQRQIVLRTRLDNSFAIVEIEDNGVGMTEEFMRERLFHPFQTTKTQGMGIGMYESFQYVNGIGGSIKVLSTPNQGAKFSVCLPLAHSDQFISSGNVKDETLEVQLAPFNSKINYIER